MVLDFAALPPEINSGLMYTGAGSGPLMAAATAYGNLAAELTTTATSWESIVSTLTTEQWTGAGSAAAAAAAKPYVTWLSSTAAALEHASAQASSSAAAYEAAFTATVPPPVVAANRATLAALVATNFLGINTPAIAATEAHYAEMWVQDATAMYTYSAAATAAAALQPLTPASPTASPAAAATQAAAVPAAAASSPAQGLLGGLESFISNPTAIFTGLNNAVNTTPLGPLLGALDGLGGTPIIFNGVQEIGVTTAWFVGNTIPTAVSLIHTVAATPAAAASDFVTPLAGGASIGEGTLVNSVGGLGGAATAGMGEASAVGGLSVPASWSSAAPATLASSTAPLEGSGWTAGVEEAGSAGNGGIIPGMPGMAGAAKGAGAFSGPRYGFKPIVMPKQVVV
jgi:PPE-repeat protein